MELLFDIQNPRKITKSEEKQNNAKIIKKYNSVEDVVMENISKNLFEMKLCPEIAAFKDEITNEASMFKPSTYFPSAEKSMTMIGEQKPNEIEMAFKDMNFFTESLDENYLNDMDFPDMGQENQAAEENDENYGNTNDFGNENEESTLHMNGQNVLKYCYIIIFRIRMLPIWEAQRQESQNPMICILLTINST